MKRSSRLATVMLALLLSGCWWQGPVFYRPSPSSAAPLIPGLYDAIDKDGTTKRNRISRAADGSFYSPDDKGNGGGMFFAPLPISGRDVWVVEIVGGEADRDGAIYGLLERQADGVATAQILECEGSETLVTAAGGTVEGTRVKPGEARTLGSPICSFPDRAALERALTAYVRAHSVLQAGVTLKRIGD